MRDLIERLELVEAKRLPKLPVRMQEVVDYLRRDPKRTYISYEGGISRETPGGRHRSAYPWSSISAHGGGNAPAGNIGSHGSMNIKLPTFQALKKRGVIVREGQEGRWVLAPEWRD